MPTGYKWAPQEQRNALDREDGVLVSFGEHFHPEILLLVLTHITPSCQFARMSDA